ncbi:RING finger protein 145-like isoform X2 [Rhineura floridana]|uniref:RING finger protein 145-like isoform X2 n=1 Tax=Rhineura floridana TaxID=261503 RepID=UPI002AC81577|nr:RING finger protein 145-like isoform X2 [Rhineura floridana]
MPRLEEVANVVLRVPSIALLDLLYRWDVQAFAEMLHPRSEATYLQRHHLWNVYYAGHAVCLVVLMLPIQSLVKLYLYILTVLLLYVGHQTARDYIRHEMEREFHGAVYNDPVALSLFATALTGQVIVVTLCALLLKTKQVWLFGPLLLPLAARLCCLPLHTLPLVNSLATALTVLEALYVASSGLSVPLRWAAAACREVPQVLEVYRLITLGMSLWRQLAVPLLFLVFWLALFTLQLYALVSASSGNLLSQQGLPFLLLSRGVTEGMTLLLLALQTGLLDLQLLQRTFLLSIILFIVVTSTLQSMIEIADPIVLGLGASQNRSLWKHFRGVSMCLFLLVFPGFMAYKIAHFFRMDFWLLILVSSCMLTSLQVMGTLFIYALFMIEFFQDTPMEKMDEIIYYINAVSRVLEFLVAVCVVAYGTWESIFGEWSWMGASVIIIHCYFNVWLRAQSGWKSFLLRREAAKKIRLLPRATRGQLEGHDDVCAICFQELTLAVIMQCGHFFHEDCLRKWFFVQDTCPLCHQPVNLLASKEGPADQGGAQEAEPAPEREEAPGNEEYAARGCAECPSCDRTVEAGESSRMEQQGPLSAEAAGEDLQPFSGPGESAVEKVPCQSTPRRERGASATTGNSDQVPFRLDFPPLLKSPVKVHSGDWLGSSGDPVVPEQDTPGGGSPETENELSNTSGNVGPQHLAALGIPAEEYLEGTSPTLVAISPSATAEDKVILVKTQQQQGDVSDSLAPSVNFDGKTKDSVGSRTTLSPS